MIKGAWLGSWGTMPWPHQIYIFVFKSTDGPRAWTETNIVWCKIYAKRKKNCFPPPPMSCKGGGQNLNCKFKLIRPWDGRQESWLASITPSPRPPPCIRLFSCSASYIYVNKFSKMSVNQTIIPIFTLWSVCTKNWKKKKFFLKTS